MRTYALVVGILALFASFGCGMIRENHYVASVDPESNEPVNFFRVQVRGWAGLAGARYVAGYYDERAVDLYFGQTRPKDCSSGGFRPIFVDDQTDPGSDKKIKPLSPDPTHGSFVMILSTDAKAVADAIGQFAENQVAADAIVNLTSRSEIRDLQRDAQRIDRNSAVASGVDVELASLMGAATNNPTPERYLAVLNAIANAQGARTPFTDFGEARAYFEARAAGGGDR